MAERSKKQPLTTTYGEWRDRSQTEDPKFLVLSMGGTIVSHETKDGLDTHPRPLELFKRHTTVRDMANLEFRKIANLDSTNMRTQWWTRVAEVIAQQHDNYDGFLVTHGTDTMAHTAGGVRFLLGDHLRVPVVFTGSQIPLGFQRSDAVSNLEDSITALKAARQMEINDVMLVFNHSVMKGNRVVKESEVRYHAFTSPAFPELATVDSKRIAFDKGVVSVVDATIEADRSLDPIKIKDKFASGLLEVGINPSDENELEGLHTVFENGSYKALALRSFGAGNLPDYVLPTVRYLSSLGIPVLTESSHPGAGMSGDYKVAQEAEKAGAVQTGNMIPSTAITKLRILLARGLDLDQIRSEMIRPFYGEVG